jgi:predicted RNase H-like HicB family nuclease
MQFTVILGPQEEGGYTVRCLELPGAISEGDTKAKALENIKDAIELILEVLREDLKDCRYSNAEIHKVELADVQ